MGAFDETRAALSRAQTPLRRTVDPALIFGPEQSVPSTQAQREVFFASRADRQVSLSYNHAIAIGLEGPMDRDALYSALRALIERHEALRGRFSADGARFLVRERFAFELPVLELGPLAPDERRARRDDFFAAEAARPFDLLEGPLFRAVLVHESAQEAQLLVACHHAAVDAWSLNLILDELPRLYSALVLGRADAGLPAPDAYVDYLRKAAAREAQAGPRAAAYWRGIYPAAAPILDLPVDRAYPRKRDLASRRTDHRVDRAIVAGLKRVAAANGCSPFVGLLAAYALFLARIAGQQELVVGVPAAGQVADGSARLLGHDTRVLPLRCVLKEGDTFGQFAGRLMDHFLAAYENQWVSHADLVAQLAIPVDAARAPLASVGFSFDPGMKREAFHFEGLRARHRFLDRAAERFEISVNAVLEEEELLLECSYSAAVFDDATMVERMAQLEQLMASIVARPDMPAAELPLVPPAQVASMDRLLNATAMAFESALCVDQLVQRSVGASPAKCAAESAGLAVSYAALWARSGRIANAILGAGLGPRPLVGVMLDRSADMVAVLLGVWRAGGAFVPLDPAFPADRLQYMVDHSAIGLLLTEGALRDAPPMARVRRLDVSDTAAYPEAVAALPAPRSASDIAYVLYTSGSTGKPKGVQITHRALNNFLRSMMTRAPCIGVDDRLLAVTTLSFDIAQLEIWLPLVAGATTVIVDRATTMDGRAIAAVLLERRITFLQATPTTWRLLLLAGWSGNRQLTALCGGEALPRELADELLQRVGALWNVYGPTETTVWSTIDRVDAAAVTGGVTIGRPIGNTQAYILDLSGNWVPRGSTGELWLGGEGVALGYLGRDDLTAERFRPNPFTGEGRIYRTGDLVRLRADGRIEFIGRNDFQVKINGYRIELPEVQQALSRVAAIAQCVVVGKAKSAQESALVAYYSVRPGMSTSATELRAALRASLPDYMVPGAFLQVAQLPLTQNGKIDVKALPDPFAPARRPAAHPAA
jgi:amino acid adenylation domain-containing protein